MHDPEVRLAFFKEVGQQADFQAVLEHDFIGANARARRIDERRAKENSAESLRKPAIRVATAILMYSFGGLRRDSGKDGDLLPPGISEPELLSICIGPDLDSTTVVACLKELKEQCLYLHFDGVRYCFKKDPNITLLIEQEADAVGRDEKRVRERIKEMLEERLVNHREAIIWPDKSIGIDDRDPSFLIAYLPLEFSGTPQASQEATAKELLEKYGDKPRQYRNGLGLGIPAADQIEILRRSVRYLMAAEQVKTKAKQLNLTDEQRSQLREQEATRHAEAESALLKLYMEVWLPRAEGGGLGIERVAPGGRPLQTMLNEKKQAKIHERISELITQVQPRVFPTVKAAKIVELFKLGEGQPPVLGTRTSDIVNGFYSFLGFTRLLSASAIRKGIAEGIGQSVFAYAAGSVPTLGPDGRYQLALDKVRFGPPDVSADEIDLDSGFLIMPPAIPKPAAGPEPIPPGPTLPGAGPEPIPPGPVPPPGPAAQKSVELTFRADRNQLFTAWSAVANLADLAGTVSVIVKAESEKGFDQSKLRNGVLEPLEEADLIKNKK